MSKEPRQKKALRLKSCRAYFSFHAATAFCRQNLLPEPEWERPDEPEYDSVDQLFIDPDECIDCDACVEACPVDAITPEDMVPERWRRFIDLNAAYYRR